MQRRRGFTLMESLTLVAVLGVLGSVGIAIVDGVRENERDDKRVSDVEQLEFALEEYYEVHGHYPVSTDCNSGLSDPNEHWCRSSVTSDGSWIKHNGISGALAEYFPDGEPLAPDQATEPGTQFPDLHEYYYFSHQGNGAGQAGQWYMIVTRLEAANHPIQADDIAQTCTSGLSYDFGATSGVAADNAIWTFSPGCIGNK